MSILVASGNCVEIGTLENGNGDGYLIECDNGIYISITGFSKDDIRANNFLFNRVTIKIEGETL